MCILFASINSLLEKVEQETWRETGISFVTSVTRLMERLLDYRYLLRNLPDLFSGHMLSPARGSPDLKIETTWPQEAGLIWYCVPSPVIRNLLIAKEEGVKAFSQG